MAKKRKAPAQPAPPSPEDTQNDSEPTPGNPESEQPGGSLPGSGGAAAGKKPTRRRQAGQPPAPVEAGELNGGSRQQPSRKRHKGRAGENGRQDGDEGPASPTRLPEQPDGFIEPRNISRLAETVVKVFCVHSEPNYSLPWQRKRQFSSTGSGFIIPGRRILTNAHCVDHHSQVKVRRRGSDTKYVATVLAVGTECDIACLTVKDDDFWDGTEAVSFGELPHLQDSILVIGYPIGGDSQSVTSGVVSRIEVTAYVHGSSELLGMQIDAAINSGNSGGPAFNGAGECVGIAFQSLKNEDAENIGYVIPPPVIHHFLDDFARNGKYTGFPGLGVEWQKMESPYLQKSMGMKAGQKGVLVRRVEPTLPACKQLRKGDVLLSFDGTQIGNDGTVAFRSGERINFSYLVSEKQNHEAAQIELLRDGKVLKVRVQLKGPHKLIPSHIGGQPPSYFIFAGLVFTPVTVPYLRSEYGKEFEFDAPVKILDKLLHDMAAESSDQVIVVGQVLASEVNIGFENIVNTSVLRINDKPVSNLRQVVAAVEGCRDRYIRMDLDYDQARLILVVVVLDTAAAQKSTAQILELHGIPADRSPDLQAK